jgi:putative peptide zinc metalloprotease protein
MNGYFLAGKFSFTATDDADPGRCYCIFVGSRVFHGSHAVMQLLDAISQESDITRITANMNAARAVGVVTEEEVRQIIDNRFIPTGVVSTSPPKAGESENRRSYLFFTRTLFGARVVDAASRLFVSLFNPKIALFLSIACFTVLGAWFWTLFRAGISPWDPLAGFGMTLAESVLFYGLVLASFLFHELGHAAATRRFGASPAEIGFGLYLIFPVFYCNVTDAWRLPRHQRIVISAAGAYFQMLAAALLVPFQLITQNDVLSLAISVNIIAVLVTLNPFFRFDGYWIYSDFFSIPNLRERSSELIDGVMRAVVAGSRRQSGATTALRLYAAGSALFFSGFAVMTVNTTWKSITHVPVVLGATAAKFHSSPWIKAIVDIAAGSSVYLLYLTGCVLTSAFIASTVIRGALSLHGQWRIKRQ